jgi:hypothetical protein
MLAASVAKFVQFKLLLDFLLIARSVVINFFAFTATKFY